MFYLLFTILTTVGIISMFKLFSRFGIDSFQAIVWNYLTCVTTGFLIMPSQDKSAYIQVFSNGMPEWSWWAIGLGTSFVLSFYMIAKTTQISGVSVSSVASKISMTIPIIIGLFVMKTQLRPFTFINYLGLILALLSVVFISVRKNNDNSDNALPGNQHLKWLTLALPVGVFLFTGVTDTVLNYASHSLLNDVPEAFFSVTLFLVSGLVGSLFFIIGVILGKIRFQRKNMLAGFILGVPNYFSIYFLIKTLGAFHNDAAFVLPLVNIGVILSSMAVGVIWFKEKLSRMNYLGLVLSALAILMISYQELIGIH